MLIEIKRHTYTEKSTIGDLYLNGEYECHTLEDHLPEDGVKVAGSTCIPAGVYEVIINLSPRFGKYYPRLLDVPGFTGILIHKGNTDVDTKGCILVGMEQHEDRITRSTEAFEHLFERLLGASEAHDPIVCTITNEEAP